MATKDYIIFKFIFSNRLDEISISPTVLNSEIGLRLWRQSCLDIEEISPQDHFQVSDY